MDTLPDTLTLSIEPQEGAAFQHGFHLGTDLKIARALAQEEFHRQNAKTVALKLAGGIVDTFDGMGWHSDLQDDLWRDQEAGLTE